MVELEGAVNAQRGRLDFNAKFPNAEVHGRGAPAVAGRDPVQVQIPPHEFLPDLPAIRIAEHPVGDQRRSAPDIGRRVFVDDGHHQGNGINGHRAASIGPCLIPASRTPDSRSDSCGRSCCELRRSCAASATADCANETAHHCYQSGMARSFAVFRRLPRSCGVSEGRPLFVEARG